MPIESIITEDSIIADINNDGFIDILISQRNQANGAGAQNRAWINDGQGVFSDETATRFPELINSTFDATLIDIDNDGDGDIIYANASVVSGGTPLLDHLLINDGTGIFTT